MNKKIKITLISLAGLVILGAAGVAAYNEVCIDKEAQMFREMKARQGGNWDREKLENLLLVLEAEEARKCAFWTSLTKEDEKRIAEEKQRGHEEYLREVEARRQEGLLKPQKLSASELGIRELDAVLHPTKFRQLNVWYNYLDENNLNSLIIAAAGGDYLNPRQGMIVVLERGYGAPFETYSSPTATGPLKIISETDAVLTLESLKGEYEVYHEDKGTREYIKTPGGSVYYFNLRTKMFQTEIKTEPPTEIIDQ